MKTLDTSALDKLITQTPPPVDMSADIPRLDKPNSAYAAAALAGEVAAVRTTAPGNRNNALNTAAVKLGNLVASGALDRAQVEAALTDAALAAGLPQDEIKATLRSGIEAGIRSPRQIPTGDNPKRTRPAAGKKASPTGRGRSFNATDVGNSQRLVTRYGAKLHYCFAWRTWLVWDGRRWKRDETGAVIRMAKSTVRSMYAEAAKFADENVRKEAAKHAMRSESESRLKAMINLAQSESGIPVTPDQLDNDPWLLNCKNGTIDLRTGTLLPHDPQRLITKLSPVEYTPDAKLALFDDFLHTVTRDDPVLVVFLQRVWGYTLTGLATEEKLFFVHGPTGTGKSTMLECAKSALGEYARTADFESFLQRSFTGGPRNDIADLAGARFVASIEIDEGAHMAEGLVKTLIGGDTVKARHLYEEGFEFRPQFKLFLAANHAPRVKAEDDAMWRRILRVPFDAVIPREKQSPMVKAILRDPDKGGPAFLAWAVEGCLAWQRDGLGIPLIVERATEEYREQQDTLRDFWADCAVFSLEAWTPAGDLRKVYEAWCDDMGIGKRERLSARAFGDKLKAKGCQSERRHEGRGWRGIGLLLTAPRPTNEEVDSEVQDAEIRDA